MNKVLQSTERGQITLPKKWREKFDTNYFSAEIANDQIIITPLLKAKNLDEELTDSWQEYKDGKFITHEELMKKYGI